jgi:hypothetical protein
VEIKAAVTEAGSEAPAETGIFQCNIFWAEEDKKAKASLAS